MTGVHSPVDPFRSGIGNTTCILRLEATIQYPMGRSTDRGDGFLQHGRLSRHSAFCHQSNRVSISEDRLRVEPLPNRFLGGGLGSERGSGNARRCRRDMRRNFDIERDFSTSVIFSESVNIRRKVAEFSCVRSWAHGKLGRIGKRCNRKSGGIPLFLHYPSHAAVLVTMRRRSSSMHALLDRPQLRVTSDALHTYSPHPGIRHSIIRRRKHFHILRGIPSGLALS